MSTHKHIDKICIAVIALALVIAVVFANGESLGLTVQAREMGYESRLFDRTKVHTIDIVADDWDSFIKTCTDEEYISCAVVIDGKAYKNVAIRAKGNTSLSTVASMNSERYSFKIEFDHYDKTKSYYGLDKLCLNNIIQDNTYMKDYLVYTMMYEFGVAAPLCSFTYITVNGDDWGLYLAVEGIEDGFMSRNYNGEGELYKPDSLSMGGGRGNGRDFEFNLDDLNGFDGLNEPNDIFGEGDGQFPGSMPNAGTLPQEDLSDGGQFPDSIFPSDIPDVGDMPDGASGSIGQNGGMTKPGSTAKPDGQNGGFNGNFGGFDNNFGDFGGFDNNFGGGNFGGGMGSSDVKLQYIDDDPESYSNIFDNAKTKITDADKTRLISSLKSLSAYENIDNVVDVEQVIAYFVVHSFVDNGDSYTGSMVHNYYLYENDGVLSMIPWDYNLAFGTFQSSDASSSVNAPIDSPADGSEDDRPMVGWIFSDESYTALYHDCYEAFLEQFFESGFIDELITDTLELIAPYVEKDPTKFCTYDEFLTGVTALRKYCSLRAESVKGQLEGTIPSTKAGQAADSSSLISTDDLKLSDMGTMNNGGGNDFGKGDFDGGFGGGDRPDDAGTAMRPRT